VSITQYNLFAADGIKATIKIKIISSKKRHPIDAKSIGKGRLARNVKKSIFWYLLEFGEKQK